MQGSRQDEQNCAFEECVDVSKVSQLSPSILKCDRCLGTNLTPPTENSLNYKTVPRCFLCVHSTFHPRTSATTADCGQAVQNLGETGGCAFGCQELRYTVAVDLPLQARLKSGYILTRYTYAQSKHRAGNTCIIIY